MRFWAVNKGQIWLISKRNVDIMPIHILTIFGKNLLKTTAVVDIQYLYIDITSPPPQNCLHVHNVYLYPLSTLSSLNFVNEWRRGMP